MHDKIKENKKIEETDVIKNKEMNEKYLAVIKNKSLRTKLLGTWFLFTLLIFTSALIESNSL